MVAGGKMVSRPFILSCDEFPTWVSRVKEKETRTCLEKMSEKYFTIYFRKIHKDFLVHIYIYIYILVIVNEIILNIFFLIYLNNISEEVTQDITQNRLEKYKEIRII